jgi:hypothetical protein
MSTPRFASIHAGLLARKGEAQPWSHSGAHSDAGPAKKPLDWDTPEALRIFDRHAFDHHISRADHGVGDAHLRDGKKCMVRMSHHDYERLGILAVKQGKTRQRLLQEAVDRLLDGIGHSKFAGGCACLSEERCGSKF